MPLNNLTILKKTILREIFNQEMDFYANLLPQRTRFDLESAYLVQFCLYLKHQLVDSFDSKIIIKNEKNC
jgi:hypothetical protein